MNDRRLENYLREFQPRKPRALPEVELATAGWRRLAAAAVMVFVCGASFWVAWRDTRGNRPAPMLAMESKQSGSSARRSNFVLTRAALEDHAALDAILEEESRKFLPRFDLSSSTLRVLAKE